MLVATAENIAGHRTIGPKGQCFGVVVRSRWLRWIPTEQQLRVLS